MIKESGSAAVKEDEIESLMRSMALDFSKKMPARLEKMSIALQQIRTHRSDEEKTKEPMNTLLSLLHSLGGSAGTFGFDELGIQARQLEQMMVLLMREKLCTEEALVALESALSALQSKLPAA